jgi:hypothetical protein
MYHHHQALTLSYNIYRGNRWGHHIANLDLPALTSTRQHSLPRQIDSRQLAQTNLEVHDSALLWLQRDPLKVDQLLSRLLSHRMKFAGWGTNEGENDRVGVHAASVRGDCIAAPSQPQGTSGISFGTESSCGWREPGSALTQ